MEWQPIETAPKDAIILVSEAGVPYYAEFCSIAQEWQAVGVWWNSHECKAHYSPHYWCDVTRPPDYNKNFFDFPLIADEQKRFNGAIVAPLFPNVHYDHAQVKRATAEALAWLNSDEGEAEVAKNVMHSAVAFNPEN